MKKALFLDLDHTLIRPRSGEVFPQSPDDWEFMPGLIACLLCEVDRHGPTSLDVIIVTNQGGVLAGFHTEGEIEQKLRRIRYKLADAIGCPVYFYAAYKNDYNRKPLPGMAYQAALANRLSLFDSTMIGDMDSDKEFALNAGIGTFHFIQDYLPTSAK